MLYILLYILLYIMLYIILYMLLYIVYNLKEQEEMEEMKKIMKNLEKLLKQDFDFINAGRVVVATESREVNINMVNEICNRLNIQTNHIKKDELEKIIAELELELDYEIPKLKRIKS